MGLSGASCEVTEVVINRGNLNLNLTLKVDCWQTVKLMAVEGRVVFWPLVGCCGCTAVEGLVERQLLSYRGSLVGLGHFLLGLSCCHMNGCTF